MTQSETFYAKVEQETGEARGRFGATPNHLDRDLPDRTYWVSVITEEVGKLARVSNKLAIIPQHDAYQEEREKWLKEGEYRMVTIASLVRRMNEQWRILPDQRARR